MALRKFAVLNSCTAATPAAVQDWVRAVRIQITRDVNPLWDATASVTYFGPGSTIPAGYFLVAVVDDADQAGALGYHDVGPHGEPMSKVFVRTTLTYGEEPSVTLSHEVLEMMGDPFVALLVQDADTLTKGWAREVCDPVEANSYGITLPATSTKPARVVQVSDFVLPAYFNQLAKGLPNVRWNFRNTLAGPVPTLDPGGYLAFFQGGSWSQVDRARTVETAMATSLRRLTNPFSDRRLKRLMPRSSWVRMTATKVG